MSWFNVGRSNSGHQEDSPSHINKQKHKQIESLREYIPGYLCASDINRVPSVLFPFILGLLR
jgi:hypothetical protein